jgi:hypothetical protein
MPSPDPPSRRPGRPDLPDPVRRVIADSVEASVVAARTAPGNCRGAACRRTPQVSSCSRASTLAMTGWTTRRAWNSFSMLSCAARASVRLPTSTAHAL